MIELSNVTKKFQTLVAIRDLSLKIPRGEVLGVLGPNGAGKTTLFKLIAGLLSPDTGTIYSINGNWPSIGYKPERLLYPNQMRVHQYLELVTSLCNLHGSNAKQAVTTSLEQVDLTYASDKLIKDCSKGMRQRLGLAQAILGDPPLILLDEPSNGLDPEGQSDICQQIEDLHHAGKSIVLASHQLQEVTQVCTHLVILNNGRIHYENSMAKALAERPHTVIQTDKDVEPMKLLLENLHDDVLVHDQEIILNNQAISIRPHVIGLLINSGYDIVQVSQSRVTLAEIYAEAVK